MVGITGSVGKTTAKEMIAGVLSQGLNTLKTRGNLNGDIGAPMLLLDLMLCGFVKKMSNSKKRRDE